MLLTLSGELQTQAQWLRAFVAHHPGYKKDSHISESVCRDILDTQIAITHGRLKVSEPLVYRYLRVSSVLLMSFKGAATARRLRRSRGTES